MAGQVIVKDRGLNKILANMRDFDGARLAVGIQGPEAGAIHPDGEIDNVTLGVIHEFGAPGANIPERSFMRETFDIRVGEWARVARKIAEKVYSTTPERPGRALGVLGEFVVADIQKQIARGIPPPLEPATANRKGSQTPLIDTGILRDSITWTVRMA